MKKTLVSAVTSALVIGAAATTFAAANPFSDVPPNHWAYDAINTLSKNGVLEGYGDTTFRGERSITRYEMAQMIAKAMAKTKVTTSDKALIDRLAAEFSDELNNLGVRVAKLEKNADMVKWTGELRYQYFSRRVETPKDGTNKRTIKNNTDRLQLRLFPTAEINDNWKVKARLTAANNMKRDNGTFGNSGEDKATVKLTYAFAEGNYKNFNVKMGKMPLYSVADDGLVVDDFFSGFELGFGNKVKLTLQGGRWDLDNTLQDDRYGKGILSDKGKTASYWGAEVNANISKLRAGVAYRQFKSDAFKNIYGYKNNKDKASIISVGAKYAFTKSVSVAGAYANNNEADKFKTGWTAQLNYKGTEDANAHTWGMFAGYRSVGQNVGLAPTYDTYIANTKGWFVGAGYVPFKNIRAEVQYFDGKKLEDKRKAKTIYARLSAFF